MPRGESPAPLRNPRARREESLIEFISLEPERDMFDWRQKGRGARLPFPQKTQLGYESARPGIVKETKIR
ncbi:MAG: hypothetical protein QOI22_618 [Verrucomicrobiota bacterium]